MAMAMVAVWPSSSSSIVSSPLLLFFILMLLLIILIILFACKPWRFFSSPIRSYSSRTIKVEDKDIERPLVSEDSDSVQNHSYGPEGASHITEVLLNSPRNHGLAFKHRLPTTATQLGHSDSFVLDIAEDTYIGQTLKRPLGADHGAEKKKHGIKEDYSYDSRYGSEEHTLRDIVPNDTADQRRAGSAGSNLVLEVISGPSRGIRYSIQSTNTSGLPLTLGRVPPSALLLKDSEVSGKHAMINWNLNKLKWELVDMGSLNGTLLNSKAIHHANSESRHWGDPAELASGDIITLGTTSKIFVQITSQSGQIPFRLGMASDPMSLRRGGKKLPMEDVCYYRWPLDGADQFGLFGICDGHGGAAAAVSASKLLPDIVASVLGDSFKRERVLSQCDASDVLREAFSQTEACMNHYYEGCTATAVLIWVDGHENFYVQCANVGDSACVVSIDGNHVKITEDHRLASNSERQRFEALGEPLKDGETRLCGLNLARMLGDKFLKQQDTRFSSEPYISQVVYIHQSSKAFAVLASDGFWDVVNYRKACQLVHETREKNVKDGENAAEKIANALLTEAKTQRTKDNTSIIFLDFDRDSSCRFDS